MHAADAINSYPVTALATGTCMAAPVKALSGALLLDALHDAGAKVCGGHNICAMLPADHQMGALCACRQMGQQCSQRVVFAGAFWVNAPQQPGIYWQL